MGRPIKKQFFGSFNTDGVGGEALYSNGTGNVAITFGNVGLGYFAANVGVTFSAPSVAGGTTAVADAVYLYANGAIKSVHVSNAGSGYTSAATLTFTGANTTPATGTANTNPTSTTLNAINANAWVDTGTVGKAADIVKQVGSRRFRVQNADGTSNCKLVTTAAPAAAGEMVVTATFEDNSTFSVAKLTDRLAYDADGNRYLWVASNGHLGFATASNSTVPPTVTISNV